MDASKKRVFSNIIGSFFLLILAVMIISLIGSTFGWQASYVRINSVTGLLDKNIVAISNLFSGEELRYILGNAMVNFVAFAPLGAFLISLIGIGIAYKSGLLGMLFTVMGRHISKFWLTFVFVLLGIISNAASDFGYVVLLPLAAIFYLVNNRNPLIGILATFVGVSAGQGVNVVLSNLEYSLEPYTELAAKLTDDQFILNAYNNFFFCIVAVVALTFLITYITEKIIIPHIPKYRRDEEIIEELVIGRKEKRGFLLAAVGSTILLFIYIYMLIPGLPGSGILLDSTGKTYSAMLFGSDSYFSSSIVYVTSLILMMAGCLYGFGAKTIKGRNQFTKALYESLNSVGSVLVLLFFASQFIAIFKRSNLGIVITSWLTGIIKTLNFTSVPLILLVFLFIGIANIFLTSSVSKWTILSPIVIPLFMGANMTAEFSQAVFRVGESATNILTPLSAYFIIFAGYLEIYNKNDKCISFRDCYKMLWPYGVAIALLWIFILVTWYIIGLPIGFGVYPTV
ncbi:MAG: AbgT family transporter [Bacilli bacterium]|jgi:aminobenzoyl-glutamate transport protein